LFIATSFLRFSSTSPPQTSRRAAALSIAFIGLDFFVLEDYSNLAG
jgi:hypothetical protein